METHDHLTFTSSSSLMGQQIPSSTTISTRSMTTLSSCSGWVELSFIPNTATNFQARLLCYKFARWLVALSSISLVYFFHSISLERTKHLSVKRSQNVSHWIISHYFSCDSAIAYIRPILGADGTSNLPGTWFPRRSSLRKHHRIGHSLLHDRCGLQIHGLRSLQYRTQPQGGECSSYLHRKDYEKIVWFIVLRFIGVVFASYFIRC